MPTELVMTSATHPTRGAVVDAVQDLHPQGYLADYRGGEIVQVIDADGRGLLTLFPPRPIEAIEEASRTVRGEVRSLDMWTDMTIPYGDPTQGRALAEAIAVRAGGRIHERN
ncbi:hypothetical protein [Agrococcus baldri]|uniref:Uncharacterized protein n=1 Tax=Agrococcus baldri TaxID=153730 RepID=A0AA87UTG8_9MICO|nr:hypothetical protein [Agrococcus baldri]GEK81480.1 hypothetical protein ABA31_28310 [Agrococcus baldri]